MAGDQQAALIGQACMRPGMIKATYGTGGFVLLNAGPTNRALANGLLTHHRLSVRRRAPLRARRIDFRRRRDGAMAARRPGGPRLLGRGGRGWRPKSDPEQPVYLVPAFAGLGAPYWSSEARGAIVGLTRGATRKELARAALESVGYQSRDLMAAMRADCDRAGGAAPIGAVVRVDGGMAASDWTMQFLADMLEAPVERPGEPGDDGARRRLSRGMARRRLRRAGELLRRLAARSRFAPTHDRGDARGAPRRLARRARPHASAARALTKACGEAPVAGASGEGAH